MELSIDKRYRTRGGLVGTLNPSQHNSSSLYPYILLDEKGSPICTVTQQGKQFSWDQDSPFDIVALADEPDGAMRTYIEERWKRKCEEIANLVSRSEILSAELESVREKLRTARAIEAAYHEVIYDVKDKT